MITTKDALFDALMCKVPPPGWWCSREPLHSGPCAARPVPEPPKCEFPGKKYVWRAAYVGDNGNINNIWVLRDITQTRTVVQKKLNPADDPQPAYPTVWQRVRHLGRRLEKWWSELINDVADTDLTGDWT